MRKCLLKEADLVVKCSHGVNCVSVPTKIIHKFFKD